MEELKIVKTEITIGLEKPVRLLHVTDSHIAEAYDSEGEELVTHARARTAAFEKGVPGRSRNFFDKAREYVAGEGITMVHTGDLIDFLSEANFDFLDRAFEGIDSIYAAGNHDFCHFVGRAKEDLFYKRENMKKIAPHIKENLVFDSRVIGGVNIVTLDNTYYRITDGQTDMLRAEAAKGYPILLFMHVPLYVKGFAKERMKRDPCAYVVAAPRELLYKYPTDRFYQQAPDEATLRAVEYIKSEPLIKALFTGHCHENHSEVLDNGVVQYITGAGYNGDAREIVVK